MIDKLVNDLWLNILSRLPWWTPWVFWAAVALAVLFVLAMVKSVAGWPGVIALLVAIVGGVSGIVGFRKGVEWADKRRPAPKVKPPRKPLWPF